MSRIRILVFVCLLGSALSGFAEQAPAEVALRGSAQSNKVSRFELFGGFGMLREGITPAMGLGTLSALTNSGFETSFGWNAGRHIAVVADFAGAFSSGSTQASHHYYTLMLGPRFTIVRARRFVPWVQFLAGAAENNWSKVPGSNANQVSQLASGQDIAHNMVGMNLATRLSGGVDLPITKRLASRTELGWLRTQGLRAVTDSTGQFSDVKFDLTTNHLMFSTGVVLRF